MRSYFFFSVALAAIVAFNFGLNTVNFSGSKEFAIVDFKWCEGQPSNIVCPKGDSYGSLIGGGVFWGGAVGSCFIGLLSNHGRRKAMMILHAINIVGSIISSAAQCFSMFLLGRFLAGISVGMSGLVAMYLTEICPSDKRGTYGIVYPFFITLGQLMMTLWQLLHGRVPTLGENNAPFEITSFDRFIWRSAQFWPVVFSGLALLIIVLIVKDDTPHVLIQEGKDEDAKRVIALLHGEDKVESVLAEVRSDQEALKASSTTLGIWAALKVPKYRRPLFILFGLSLMQQLSGINVFVANASKLFVSIMGRSFLSNIVGSVCVAVLFVSTLALAFVIDKFGRKTMLLFGIGLSAVLLVPPVIIKVVAAEANWVKITLAIGCVGYVAGFAVGLGGIMWLYFAEALGSEYKDAGFATATCLNWVAAGVIVTSSDPLLSWNENFVYSMYAAFTVLGFFFVLFFIKETKGIPLGHAYA